VTDTIFHSGEISGREYFSARREGVPSLGRTRLSHRDHSAAAAPRWEVSEL